MAWQLQPKLRKESSSGSTDLCQCVRVRSGMFRRHRIQKRVLSGLIGVEKSNSRHHDFQQRQVPQSSPDQLPDKAPRRTRFQLLWADPSPQPSQWELFQDVVVQFSVSRCDRSFLGERAPTSSQHLSQTGTVNEDAAPDSPVQQSKSALHHNVGSLCRRKLFSASFCFAQMLVGGRRQSSSKAKTHEADSSWRPTKDKKCVQKAKEPGKKLNWHLMVCWVQSESLRSMNCWIRASQALIRVTIDQIPCPFKTAWRKSKDGYGALLSLDIEVVSARCQP